MSGMSFTQEQIDYLLDRLNVERMDLEIFNPGCECGCPELHREPCKFGDWVEWSDVESSIRNLPQENVGE